MPFDPVSPPLLGMRNVLSEDAFAAAKFAPGKDGH